VVAAPDPAERVVTDAERDAVIAAVNRLRRDDRLVIALRHFEQMGEAEMAEVLGCATGTVKSRLSRAMARLRAQLSDDSTEGNG
jgi:RNA polymerase sigma factor (sigma-70 family)